MTTKNPHLTGRTDRENRSSAVSKFWQNCDRYHDLAEEFTRNIEIVHPSSLSGRLARCPSDYWCCGWCDTTIKYYEYRGASIL